ncbi:MAG: HAD family hydrolase [Candidatus Bathyarchaeota archaeon]|nr:MAG: HAD family hydrolase [Candidatus Bathyarchaeota archaeon]
MSLRGVLIDFGYTLAYLDKENIRDYRKELVFILKEYGYTATLDDFVSILDNTYRSISKGEVRDIHGFWKVLLKNLGILDRPTLIQELTDLRKNHMPTRFRLYDNVISILSALKKKYKLALVSNCFIGLSDILESLGLTRFFECIILSYEVGVMKPDRRIYLEALRRLKLEPEESVFVSDAISDLEGAREVGLKTMLICQGERTNQRAKDPNFKPDFQCKHISEIIDYL